MGPKVSIHVSNPAPAGRGRPIQKEKAFMITPQQNQYGQNATGTGGDAARGNNEELKGSARELGEQAKAEGKARIADARRTAADKVETLADSADAAAAQLRRDDIGHLSEYVADLADSMTRFSSNLREKSGDEMLREVSRLAQEKPALFLTGSVAIGFGLARFARSSEQRRLQADTQSYSPPEHPMVPESDTTTYTSAPGAVRGTQGASDGRDANSGDEAPPDAGQPGGNPADRPGGIH